MSKTVTVTIAVLVMVTLVMVAQPARASQGMIDYFQQKLLEANTKNCRGA